MERDWEALIEDLKREGILRTPNVIKAMLTVPRAKFLPEDMKPYSASDTPLPIGFGQTVSAPHGFSIPLSQAKHGCNNE